MESKRVASQLPALSKLPNGSLKLKQQQLIWVAPGGLKRFSCTRKLNAHNMAMTTRQKMVIQKVFLQLF